jgi:hypothetical protein
MSAYHAVMRSGLQRAAVALVVIASSLGLASPQQRKSGSFVRVRLWRAQPKHVTVDTPLETRCVPHGDPCTTTITTWERVQRVECLLVTADGRVRREIGTRGTGEGKFRVYAGVIDAADVSGLASALASWRGHDLGVSAPAAPDMIYSNKKRMFYAVVDWPGRSQQRVWMPDQPTRQRFEPEISPVLTLWDRITHSHLKRIQASPNGCTALP